MLRYRGEGPFPGRAQLHRADVCLAGLAHDLDLTSSPVVVGSAAGLTSQHHRILGLTLLYLGLEFLAAKTQTNPALMTQNVAELDSTRLNAAKGSWPLTGA